MHCTMHADEHDMDARATIGGTYYFSQSPRLRTSVLCGRGAPFLFLGWSLEEHRTSLSIVAQQRTEETT